VLGVVAGLGWLALDSTRYTTYEVHTREPVSGLIVDAPVEFHGVEVGKVARIELKDAASVRILLQIKSDAPVTAATVATITSRGLASKGFTGYVYVSLEDDASAAPVLADADGSRYRQIRTAPSRSVNMDMAISQVNENVQSMTRLLQASLDEKTVTSIKQSLESLQKLTAVMAANSEKMNTIVANAERASKRLEPLLKSGNETALALRTQTLPEAYKALANLDRASSALISNADRATTRLEPLLESSNEAAVTLQTQLLPQAYEAVAKLDRLAASLNGVTSKIEQDPSVLARGSGKRAPGPGETR